MEGFLGGLAILLDPYVLLVVLLGTVLGIFVGALPGISGSTTIALMLPMTITMGPVPAIAFLGAIYCAANFGGSITAILVNAPGDPSASATALEGYKMAEKGEAGLALGMSAISSAIGGIFSVVVLIFAAPALARAAYSFGPPEYFALALFGLSMCAAVGGDSPVKNLIAAALRPADRDGGDGPDHRRGALRLRHQRAVGRHRLRARADRPVRGGRDAGPGGRRFGKRRSPSRLGAGASGWAEMKKCTARSGSAACSAPSSARCRRSAPPPPR